MILILEVFPWFQVLLPGWNNPRQTHWFSAIYRAYPCHSTYNWIRNAHLVIHSTLLTSPLDPHHLTGHTKTAPGETDFSSFRSGLGLYGHERVSGWWFQIFFIFIPIWGRFPFWLIFFKWVETTNQVLVLNKSMKANIQRMVYTLRTIGPYYRILWRGLTMYSRGPGSPNHQSWDPMILRVVNTFITLFWCRVTRLVVWGVFFVSWSDWRST